MCVLRIGSNAEVIRAIAKDGSWDGVLGQESNIYVRKIIVNNSNNQNNNYLVQKYLYDHLYIYYIYNFF